MDTKQKAINTFVTIIALSAIAGVIWLTTKANNYSPTNPRLYQIDLDIKGGWILYDGSREVGRGNIDSNSINLTIDNDNR